MTIRVSPDSCASLTETFSWDSRARISQRRLLILNRENLLKVWDAAFPKHDFGTGRLRRYSLESFERACKQAEAEHARQSQAKALPQSTAKRAPQSTYEALLWELREYGLAQLAKQNCRERLAGLSTDQLRELIAALMRLRSRYLTISEELLRKLAEQLP
jgi:hypothetical protein